MTVRKWVSKWWFSFVLLPFTLLHFIFIFFFCFNVICRKCPHHTYDRLEQTATMKGPTFTKTVSHVRCLCVHNKRKKLLKKPFNSHLIGYAQVTWPQIGHIIRSRTTYQSCPNQIEKIGFFFFFGSHCSEKWDLCHTYRQKKLDFGLPSAMNLYSFSIWSPLLVICLTAASSNWLSFPAKHLFCSPCE